MLDSDSSGDEVLFGRSPVSELLEIVQKVGEPSKLTCHYIVVQHPDGSLARFPADTMPSHAQLHCETQAGFPSSPPESKGWDEPPHVMAQLVGCRMALISDQGAHVMGGGVPLQPSGAAASQILTSAYSYVAGGAIAVGALIWALL